MDIGWLLEQLHRAQLSLGAVVLQVALPAHRLFLALLYQVLHLDFVACELAEARVDQEAIGLEKEEVPPLVEVLLVSTFEVLVEIKLREVDVALRLVEVSEDLACQDGVNEFKDVVPLDEPVVNCLALLLQLVDRSVEVMEQLCLLILEGVDLLGLP